ncbi:MAG: diguanylate cyclase [Nitrosomonadales bacterium]|nr:MAG: diguanylate cyclase [Nitrosomonadales bacterium]
MPADAAPSKPSAFFHSGPLLPFVLLAAVILVLTAAGIGYSFIEERDKEVARLQTIAGLKSQQIAAWLAERKGEAGYIPGSRLWQETYRRWREGGDTASRDQLRARLDEFCEQDDFQDVMMAGEDGELLWSARGAQLSPSPPLREAVRQAVTGRAAVLLGPYRDAAGQMQIDFIAPFPALNGRTGMAVVFRAGPAGYLFHALQTWPVPSESGEALLFRRDGNQALFLNELRHSKDSAVKLRIPLERNNLLAARVLRGEISPGGLVEGEDYRGAAAMGVVQAIPGTGWFLVAKLDRAELYDEAMRHAIWIGLAGLLVLFVAAAGFFLLRQRQQLALAAGVQQSQTERLRALSLLSAIADSSEDAIFALDLEGRFILLNRTVERGTGKLAQEILGRNEAAIFPPETAHRQMADNRRVIDSGTTVDFEEVVPLSFGERVVLTSKSPLRDESGKVIGLLGISRDITERKRMEEALRRERDRSQRYLDTVQTLIVALDAEGRITMINSAGCQLLGYTQAELLGRQWFEHCLPQPEGMEKVYSVFRRIMDSDLEHAEFFENPVLCRDGRQRLIAWHNACLTNEAGEIIGTLSSGEDITERKQAEAALRESEARYRSVVDSVKEVIFQTDAQGMWTFLNPAWTEITGFTIDESLGKLFLDYVHPDDRQRNAELFEPLIQRKKDYCRHEIRYLHRDGGFRWIEVYAQLTLDEKGRIAGTSGTLSDITARKTAKEALYQQAEELRQHNAELERFNRATVGRELDMIALKQQVNALSRQLGEEPPYPLAFLEDPSAQPKEGEAQ